MSFYGNIIKIKGEIKMKQENTGYEYEEKLERLAQRCKKAYIRNTEDSIAYIKYLCEYHGVDYSELIYKIEMTTRLGD
jgi:hypothetical protein